MCTLSWFCRRGNKKKMEIKKEINFIYAREYFLRCFGEVFENKR